MPRRRYRNRSHGGDGCCSCCTYWHREAENIAAEYIKTRAKSSFLSKLVCCDSLRCFDRHTLQRLYIVGGIAVGLLFVITMGYASSVYRPALYTENFKETACRVERIVYNDNETSTCEWTHGRNRGSTKYKCLRIYVSYRLKGDKELDRNVTHYSTMFYESYGAMMDKKYPKTCTKQPRDCKRGGGDVEGPISVYYKHFANYIKDSPFDCFYNPDKPKEVIGTEEADVGKARGYLILIAGSFSVVALLLIFMCCTCGCQYICCTGTAVPQDIQQEMSKRGIDMQGLTVGVPAGGQGPVVYVGSAVQVVPNVPGAGQPQALAPQPLPMQPGQPPVGPQYGQYPPPGMQAPPGNYPQQPGAYPAPQPGYPAPQPGYAPPQPGYQPPPPGQYPPPQQGAYPPPPQGAYPPPQPGAYPPPQPGAYPPPQPGAYPPQQPAGYAPPPQQQGPPPQPEGGEKPPTGNYQPPTYTGLNAPEKPPIE